MLSLSLSLSTYRALLTALSARLSLSLCPYRALLTALSARVSRFWRAPDRVPPRYGPLSAGQGRARVDRTACMQWGRSGARQS